MISIALEILYGQIRSRIANFSGCFSKSIPDLTLLLKVLQLSVQVDNTVFQKPTPISMEQFVKDALAKAATLEYQNIVVKTEQTLNTSQMDTALLKLNEEMLTVIIDLILDFLQTNFTDFINVFKPVADLPAIFAQVFYTSYLQDLLIFCNSFSKLEEVGTVGLPFFQLTSKFVDFTNTCLALNPK